jgi:hypothetical protein
MHSGGLRCSGTSCCTAPQPRRDQATVEAEFTAYREEPGCELVTVAGGNPVDCVDSKRVDVYSPRTKTWRTLDNTHAVHREGAAVTRGKRILQSVDTPTRSSPPAFISPQRAARTVHVVVDRSWLPGPPIPLGDAPGGGAGGTGTASLAAVLGAATTQLRAARQLLQVIEHRAVIGRGGTGLGLLGELQRHPAQPVQVAARLALHMHVLRRFQLLPGAEHQHLVAVPTQRHIQGGIVRAGGVHQHGCQRARCRSDRTSPRRRSAPGPCGWSWHSPARLRRGPRSRESSTSWWRCASSEPSCCQDTVNRPSAAMVSTTPR